MAFDAPIAAITVACEGSSATQFEREQIVHALQNRVTAGRWEKTIAGVCLQRMQLSEWNDDAADNANLERVANDLDNSKMLLCALAAVYCVLAGLSPDATKGATHYHDKTIAPPLWTVGATMTLETAKFKFYAGVK